MAARLEEITEMSDLTRAERTAAEHWLLHQAGYRYTDYLQDLTKVERDRLKIGRLLWNTIRAEAGAEGADTAGMEHPGSGGGATAGDHRAFEEFARRN